MPHSYRLNHTGNHRNLVEYKCNWDNSDSNHGNFKSCLQTIRGRKHILQKNGQKCKWL